jgi:hypothetical protein
MQRRRLRDKWKLSPLSLREVSDFGRASYGHEYSGRSKRATNPARFTARRSLQQLRGLLSPYAALALSEPLAGYTLR